MERIVKRLKFGWEYSISNKPSVRIDEHYFQMYDKEGGKFVGQFTQREDD